MYPPQIKPSDLLKFHAALARWYKTHGRRDLPWRTTRDPYAIWISEVMLQQTQVKTVLNRYYFPFLKTFPTVETLAAAPREKVLKAWEGLGYYTRARNLHEAAKKVVHSEWWMVNSEENIPLITHYSRLTSLPGIGRNTAHAILAFAYHQPVPVLEANVKRAVARVFALKTPKDEQLWRSAETLLNHQQPFDYNQAMMDLGALVCTPKAPKCKVCPAAILCKGKDNPESYPQKKAKKSTPTRHMIIEVMEDAAGQLFLESREDKLLGGLYGFPQVPTHHAPHATRHSLGTVTHTYSHFKLIGDVRHTTLPGKKNSRDWYAREEIAKLPLSRLDHKVLALVDKRHSARKKRKKR